VEQRGDQARLIVTDHGPGISPEQLDRIFLRFAQAVPAREYGGLGLGLYLARKLCEAHGGSIHVESEPGHGATFTVDLPAFSATWASAHEPAPLH
jgi:signal transduction histidine kinase